MNHVAETLPGYIPNTNTGLYPHTILLDLLPFHDDILNEVNVKINTAFAVHCCCYSFQWVPFLSKCQNLSGMYVKFLRFPVLI
jgi:hypothetical protein